MSILILSLGSNLQDRLVHLKNARNTLAEELGSILSSSSIYETEPWGFTSENNFLNQVVILETTQSPTSALDSILAIEKKLGRIREGKGYSSRTIDIDILFYNDECVSLPYLIIPHPLLEKRKFVLLPLAEIAAEYVHPKLQKKILSLLEECEDTCTPIPIEEQV